VLQAQGLKILLQQAIDFFIIITKNGFFDEPEYPLSIVAFLFIEDRPVAAPSQLRCFLSSCAGMTFSHRFGVNRLLQILSQCRSLANLR
jgi:hypothetical protein